MRITTLLAIMAAMLAVIVTVAPRLTVADEANIAGFEVAPVKLAAH